MIFDNSFDCIIVGLGGHGSPAAYNLAARGLRVLGIEQFGRVHEKGSSHGKSRIFRQAYFEHPNYVPLLRRSFHLWKELSKQLENPSDLFHICGSLMLGEPSSVVVSGTLRSIQEYNMDHEILSHEEVRRRYPMMLVDEGDIGVFESDAGYLNPELCVNTYLKLAEESGAELHFHERLLDYQIHLTDDGKSDMITVTTDHGEYRTKKLLLTVGAWAPQIYGAEIAPVLTLHVERRVLCWLLPVAYPEEFKRIPVYIWDLGSRGNFYGFPEQAQFASSGVKVAFHSVREDTDEDAIKKRLLLRPEDVCREVTDEDVEALRAILQRKMPALNGELLETTTCMYTMTPDEHFLVDFHPKSNSVVLASPCSGHGFKFCSVMGEILSDLVATGTTQYDISLFSLQSRVSPSSD